MTAYVILLGPPGSGKGTQAERLVAELDIPHVSSGDLFRAMKNQDTPLARQIQAIMATGALVPDDVTIRLVGERLRQPDAREHGAILDGFPRTVPQAEALDDLLAELGTRICTVLLLAIQEEEVVRRISGRRSCPVCKRVYHLSFNPPEVDERCDDDGTPLLQREDDAPDVVRKRYRLYLEVTAPLIAYYRDKGLLTEIDAVQTIEDVTRDMCAVILRATESK